MNHPIKKTHSLNSIWPLAGILVVLLLLPPFVPRFYIYILGLIYVTSLLAMSLNLLVGYGGMFQFHHAVFYGVGAYTVALLLTKTSLPIWVGFVAGRLLPPGSGWSSDGFVSG